MALTTVPASLSATAITLTTAAQPNITSVGTLTGLTVSGNTALTLNTSAQPNITSVGTLTSLTSGPHLINASSSAFGGSSVQGFNTDFLVDTGQGYSRHNSYHSGGSNHQFLVNATGSTTNTIALAINKDANATFNGNVGVKVPSLLAFRANSNEGAIQVGKRGVIYADTGITTHLGNNTYITSANQRVAIENDYGSFYEQYQGNHSFYSTTQAESVNALQTFISVMQILKNGNVGIGESNPQQQLVVKNGTGDSQIKIQSGASNDAYLSFNNGTTLKHYFKQDNTGLFELYYYNGSTGVPRITVKTDGNVGIGTAQPGAPLQINTTSGIGQYIYNTTSAQAYLAFGNSDTGVYPQNFSSAGGILVGVDTDESAIFWNGSNTRMRFGTNGTGRMHITSTGNVLIGPENITPTQLLELHGSNHMLSLVNSSTSTNQYSQMQFKAGSALNWIWGANQNSTAWGGANSLNIQSTSGSIAFYTNGTTQRMRIHETSGNVSIIDGNLIFASDHGIDFSSSSPSPNTGGSSSNNLLDDYEEGTWTATLLNGGTIHSTSAATYTKVGRLVHFNLYFNISVPNNGGTFAIGGLPYTPNGGSGNFTTVSMGYYGTGNLQVAQNGIVHASQNYIYFHRADGTSATVKNSMMYANGWSSSNGFIVSGCFVHA